MPQSTRHCVVPGAIHAIHVPKIGYFPVVITRVPDRQTQEPTVFVYIDGTARATANACADIDSPHTWSDAWLGFCTIRPFQNGRWAGVGVVDDFDSSAWPVPPSLEQDPEVGFKSTLLFVDDGTMRLVANLAEPWPSATVRLIQQASAFEKALAHRAAGRKPGFWDMGAELFPVTENDLQEWRRARAATDHLESRHPVAEPCTRQIEEGDLISVPMNGGGFGVVLAARVEPRRRGCQSVIMLGLPIFQDWRVEADACQHLTPEDVIGIWNCDSIGVRLGDWTLLGKLGSFSRDRFPVPFYTEFFSPKMMDPIEARTERWGGQAFRVESPDCIPSQFYPELRRGHTLSSIGGVLDDLAAYRSGKQESGFEDLNFITGPQHAGLWRKMAAWAARQAAV
jgi:hypothetical protein